ncbi:MAG: hypothetical protein SOI13_01600 [Bifidobacterium mongoliense]|jgi:hypothetical protein|uniref:hypothetical protein n=1 Tax=Bifidobacterium mongoliense TaxID=518643 RepID=UPI002F3597C1
MSTLGVYTDNLSAPQDDQSWLVNRKSDGIQSVTLDLASFVTDDSKYFASLGADDTVGYLKSGIPLARIATGDKQGEYGPYDKSATDGRETAIEGVLESQIQVSFTRSGLKSVSDSAGMRYMGVVNTAKLPGDITGAVWHGEFSDNHQDGSPILALSVAPAKAA